MMRCNHLGQPDPDGGYELQNGRVIVRDGTPITFSHAFFDSQRSAIGSFADAATAFTDAERSFLDSAAGVQEVALLKAKHDLTQSCRGAKAIPFEGAVRDAAIKNMMIGLGKRHTDNQRVMADIAINHAAAMTAWEISKRNRT